MHRRLKVLAITKLFPNRVAPSFAVFNRQQFAALAELCDLEVLAVIPTFPGVTRLAPRSDAARFAGVPEEDEIGGLRVRHPRALFVPRLGHRWAPALWERSLWPSVRGADVDVVLGSWAFPDGLAALRLARRLGVPAVVKVHGSDLNVLARQPAIRRALERELPNAARVVAVSQPLAERAVELGVDPVRVSVVRNGVDRSLFRIRDAREARRSLGLPVDGLVVAYVGRLDVAKGVGELMGAFEALAARVPAARLVLVGGGSELDRARALAARWPDRVLVTGAQPLERVAEHIAACDVLALPSWAEGTPNVILEAFASGRPVVATAVGGIPDLVTSSTLGALVPPRDEAALAAALERALLRPWDPCALAAAAPPSWRRSAAALHDVLSEAVGVEPPADEVVAAVGGLP